MPLKVNIRITVEDGNYNTPVDVQYGRTVTVQAGDYENPQEKGWAIAPSVLDGLADMALVDARQAMDTLHHLDVTQVQTKRAALAEKK